MRLLKLVVMVAVLAAVHRGAADVNPLACNDGCSWTSWQQCEPWCSNCGVWFERLGIMDTPLCTTWPHQCLEYRCQPIYEPYGQCEDAFFFCTECPEDQIYCCIAGGCEF